MISSLVSTLVAIWFTAALVALYLLPVLIGWARHVPGLAAVVIINITLGWTFIGWVVALALALKNPQPTGPVVQVVQHMPPPPAAPPLAPPPGNAGWSGPPGPPPGRDDPAPPLVLPSQMAGPEAGRGEGEQP
jgi:Superinfection immunity protein